MKCDAYVQACVWVLVTGLLLHLFCVPSTAWTSGMELSEGSHGLALVEFMVWLIIGTLGELVTSTFSSVKLGS